MAISFIGGNIVTVVKYDIGCMAITISVMLCVFGYVYISDICILSKKIYYLFVRAFDTGRKSSIGLSILTFLTSTIALFGCRVTPIDQIKKYVIYVLQNLLNHYWLNEVIQAVCKIYKVDHTLHSSPNPWPTDREILIVMTYTFQM
jgi:hypothetical protein